MPIKTMPLHSNGHQVTYDGQAEVEVFSFTPIPGVDPNLMTSVQHTFGCCWCGERPQMRVEDDAVYIDTPCLIPDGITTVTYLEVPSGKIIVGDDLRSVYEVDDRDELADFNSALGQAQYVEVMAQKGCAYGPVGNSCPGLWKTGEDTYVIANMRYDDEEGSETEGEEIPTPPDAVKLAGIITDLWAYSVADYEDWLSKGGEPIEEMGWSYTVVEVPAGRYEFTLHAGEKGFDRDSEGIVIFADVKKVA
jgi:hypothetical protein